MSIDRYSSLFGASFPIGRLVAMMPRTDGIAGGGMQSDIQAGLSDSECQQLQKIAGILIPADDQYAVPGGDDPAIFADIIKSIGRDLADVRKALATLEGKAPEAVLQAVQPPCSDAALALGRVILQCYYRDDRVLHSLGVEPRPPFPKGHELEQGDWSLLDPVRKRAPFWRDDRKV
jgi:hypothetical protein